MNATVKRSIPELARHLKLQPGTEAELFALLGTVRDGGLVDELVTLLESWPQAEQGDCVPDLAMAEVYFRIAKTSSRGRALELCRTALDLCPVHGDALSLFEELADATWTDELCARFQVFLEDAPLHGVPEHTRATVLDKLLRAERESALRDVPPMHADPSEALTPRALRMSDVDMAADRSPERLLSLPPHQH